MLISFSARVLMLYSLITSLSVGFVLSQSTYGTIVGTVRDQSGALIPGCIVTVENTDTSVRRSAVADDAGSYVAPNLEPGTYKVKMEMPGFQVVEYANVQLMARQTIRIDGQISVASQVESVNVTTEAAPVINTEVSSIAETKTGRELVELPVAVTARSTGSTSPLSTLTSQPGVQTDASGNISVVGSKPSMLSTSIDGISSIGPRTSAPLAELFPSFNSIAEIRVSEVNNTAEFGGISDITTISKGGTNSLHGGLFENLQNTVLNARNPFSSTRPKTIMLGTLTSAGWGISASHVGTYTNSIVNGQPTLTFPYPYPNDLALPGTQNIRVSADVNYHDPSVQQWNLTIERDLGFSTGLRVSYDGSHGSNLGYTENMAQIPANTIGFAAAKSLSPFPLFSRIAQERTGARSNYHALTVAATKRLSNGVQFAANYAFSKNLSNGQGFNPTAFATQAGGYVTDPQNIDLDYGDISFTRRHRFQTTFLYEMPFGRKGLLFKNSSAWVDQVIGGWQLAGVVLLQTGPFMTVVAPGADPMGTNFANLEGAGRADIVPGVPLYPKQKTINLWINKAAFATPKNNIGRPGNSAVGSLVGPGTEAVSLSLFKSFDISERVRFQFGAAASNAFNHANYTTPNLNYGTAAFGTISNVQTAEGAGPRQIQITSRVIF